MGDCAFKVDWPDKGSRKSNRMPGFPDYEAGGTRRITSITIGLSTIVILTMAALISFDPGEEKDVQALEFGAAAKAIGGHCLADLCTGDKEALAAGLNDLKGESAIGWAWVLDEGNNVAASFSRSGAPIELAAAAISPEKKVIRLGDVIYVCQPIVKDEQIVGKVIVAAKTSE